MYLRMCLYIISRKLSRSRRSRVGKKEHHQSVQSTATFGGGGVDDSMDGAGRVGRCERHGMSFIYNDEE